MIPMSRSPPLHPGFSSYEQASGIKLIGEIRDSSSLYN